MANRATTAKPEKVGSALEDVAQLGEILPAIPTHLDFLFADRPLLPGENTEQYDVLLRSIIQQVKPADVIEAIWVKDVADLIWETKRLRRWRGQILIQARRKAADELIDQCLRNVSDQELPDFEESSANALAAGGVPNNQKETGKIEKFLQERGLSDENITARSFLMNSPAIERIDRLASLADQRRDALLREIER